MNFDIFMKVSGFTFDPRTFEKILLGNNKLASCLTAHLALERFLEAWICAYTGIEDLFINDHKNKDKIHFSMNFLSKAKLSQRMGLPLNAYKIIEKLNSIRNSFAHQHDYEGASHQIFLSIINDIDKLPAYHQKALSNDDYTVFIDDGKTQQKHVLSSESCPHELRYSAITYGLLVRCLHYMINELPLVQPKANSQDQLSYGIYSVRYKSTIV